MRNPHPGFTRENFHPENTIQNPQLKKWFGGTATPHSGVYLLHYMTGFDSRVKAGSIPVLLIHGAADNANRAWIHPWEALMPSQLAPDKRGFALQLHDAGYPVFAITFAHGHGDNFMQAAHVAGAIERTGCGRIDVIAHSKGAVTARLYASGGRDLFNDKVFLPAYRGDIRNFIAIASPMRGVDTPFRYYGYNLKVASDGAGLPMAATALLFNGQWRDFTAMTLYFGSAGWFPGQAQMLFNLVRDAGIGLGPDSATADYGATAAALYHGGTTALASSRGIDSAIRDGGSLIYRLEQRGIDPGINLGVIAGNSPFITYPLPGQLVPMPWELYTPAGDGIVFLASSMHTDAILRRGARLLGKHEFNLNHVDIARMPAVMARITSWLAANQR